MRAVSHNMSLDAGQRDGSVDTGQRVGHRDVQRRTARGLRLSQSKTG